MSWLYRQSSGLLEHTPDGTLWRKVWVGYAGRLAGLNNPDMQDVENVGPLPRGRYRIGPPVDRPDTTGHYTLPLTPEPENEMHGRGGFAVHGDTYSRNQTASHGCIVVPREIREQIHESLDYNLEVTR